jgi:hypothetical protein
VSYDEFIKILPFVVATISLVITGILGVANYLLSRDKTRLDRERLAHDRAMMYWDKRVEVYSAVWSAVTEAFEEYISLKEVADDPDEALRKWAVIRTVKEDPEKAEELRQAVKDRPDSFLSWLLSERRRDFSELEADVRKQYFFLTPHHRNVVSAIFDACSSLKAATSREDFRRQYYQNFDSVNDSYRELNSAIDETFYAVESLDGSGHPSGENADGRQKGERV